MQLAMYENERGIAMFFSGKNRHQIEQDEVAIANCGILYTIVQP